jgi:hypothetical protein
MQWILHESYHWTRDPHPHANPPVAHPRLYHNHPKGCEFPHNVTPTPTSASTAIVALQQAAQRLSSSPSVSPPVPASASSASFSPGEGRPFSRAVRNPRGHGINEKHTQAAQIKNRITTSAADTGGFSFGPPPPITPFDTKNGFIPFSNIPSIRTGPVYVPPNTKEDDETTTGIEATMRRTPRR